MKFSIPQISPVSFPKIRLFPKRSILFILSSNDSNQILPDWDFWFESGYDLYFKPHPTSQLNFNEYPSFVKCFSQSPHLSQIEFPIGSFLVGTYSTALRYSSSSISLCYLCESSYSPLLLAYAAYSQYKPRNLHDLSTIIQ